MRFYPQSFERWTLGGWIATRAAGHFASGPTHIDELVESFRAVGRDHRPWYDAQRPEPFATALRAAKTALDPDWRLNPGVLLNP